ncbi:protocadherin alpha-3-like isoform X2 [Brienomyrus brachyistius]|uniref:protocadherin alpha-3-like isoform X2 n=2 Tax=Brienomyrus brachyistius TaxID=42636 RepID=UPI0020B4390B|nr:protocadherin alpha-3-like isoform X2 [Brienomyrus brachyistius]
MALCFWPVKNIVVAFLQRFFKQFPMKHAGKRWRCEYRGLVLPLCLLLFISNSASAQIRYSVAEEVKEGTTVGNVVKDLGLDINTLMERRFRIVPDSKYSLFGLNENNGVLYVSNSIDRERICESNAACLINLKLVVENPLEIHHVAVEIIDVNDHFPTFPDKELHLEIAESTLPGAYFQLQAARDADSGINSVRRYKLNQNSHFELEVRDRGEDLKVPFLILQKHLDREQHEKHNLLLTAFDGGYPPKSGELNVTVTVLDINDNRPIFDREIYSISVLESVQIGTVILKVNVTDKDEGLNGMIEYAFGRNQNNKIRNFFLLDNVTGEIRVKGNLDFEDAEVYQLDIQAIDKGQPPMTTDCSVIIKIIDVNDNKPVIEVTSLSTSVPEDSKPGTVIAFISVTDRDSGINGKTVCNVPDNLPFELKPSFQDNVYSLITKGHLDRELVSHYDVKITATDCGDPPLATAKTVPVQISDVNDNSPVFLKNPYHLYILENNEPGASIFSVSASDKDLEENAWLSYYIVRDGEKTNYISSFLNINSENGDIYALKSFDFETMKTFQFQVVAKDSGTPSLSSNVTVNVFILDQNDNPPVILSPVSTNGSTEGVVELSRNANAGHLVTKVKAYDPDIGYNGWLSFSLQQVTDPSLFGLERYTGEIRTLRPFTETDKVTYKLVVLVKDNGNISLSASATMVINAVETKEAFASSEIKNTVKKEEENNITLYLMISVGSVSALFVFSIIGLIVMQCSKPPDYSTKYSRDSNCIDTSGNGTLCHSIQYRSGEKRYMLVGPRMSIGSAIVPGSNGNTLVVHEHSKRISGENLSLHRLHHKDMI